MRSCAPTPPPTPGRFSSGAHEDVEEDLLGMCQLKLSGRFTWNRPLKQCTSVFLHIQLFEKNG